MEFFELLGFIGILRETPKIFCKNGQLMASLTLSYLLLFSIFYLSLVFSIKPLTYDMINKASLLPYTNPKGPEFAYLRLHVKNDIRAFVGLEWTYVIIITVASLFFETTIIIASALIHGGKKLFFRGLLLSTVRSLKRPFFTLFYTTLLDLGYIFLVLANLLPMVLIVQHQVASKVLSITLAILASIPYAYLSVIWTLAFVISVLEEKSGIGALGKAAQIAKGMQIHGFVLNILFTALTYASLAGFMKIKEFSTLSIIIGLLLHLFILLVRMFCLMAYTVFYYQCKKTHGEEVELQGNISIEYSKLLTTSLVDESVTC